MKYDSMHRWPPSDGFVRTCRTATGLPPGLASARMGLQPAAAPKERPASPPSPRSCLSGRGKSGRDGSKHIQRGELHKHAKEYGTSERGEREPANRPTRKQSDKIDHSEQNKDQQSLKFPGSDGFVQGSPNTGIRATPLVFLGSNEQGKEKRGISTVITPFTQTTPMLRGLDVPLQDPPHRPPPPCFRRSTAPRRPKTSPPSCTTTEA